MTPEEHKSFIEKGKQRKLEVRRGKFLVYKEETLEFKDRSTFYQEIVEHPGAVVIVPIADDGEIFLVRQYRFPIKEILLELPAGKIDPGENYKSCAIRELQEEIGYKPTTLTPFHTNYPAPGYATERLEFFIAKGLTPSTLPSDKDEEIEVVKYPLDRLLAMVENNEIKDGKTINGLLLYEKMRRNFS